LAAAARLPGEGARRAFPGHAGRCRPGRGKRRCDHRSATRFPRPGTVHSWWCGPSVSPCCTPHAAHIADRRMPVYSDQSPRPDTAARTPDP